METIKSHFEYLLESDDMCSHLSNIDEHTLIIFDIDNTLMRPTTYFGSDEWFFYLEKKMNSLKEAEKIWNESQYKIIPKAVDSKVPSLIKELQNKGMKTLGLTARTADISDITEQHLEKIGIELNKSTFDTLEWKVEGSLLNSPDSPEFINGIIYTGETNIKGKVFEIFFNEVLRQKKVEKILYFDDKEKHIKSMSEASKRLNLKFFTGVRYSKTDLLTSAFLNNPDTYIKNFS